VTAPEPTGAEVPEELLVVLASMAALAAWEEATLAAIAPVRQQIDALTRAIAKLWVETFGTLDTPADERITRVRDALVRGLADVDHRVSSVLTDRAAGAAALSAENALLEVEDQAQHLDDSRPLADLTVPDDRDELGPVIPGVLDALDDAVRARLDEAAALAADLALEDARWNQVIDVMAKANQAATTAERAAAWSTTAAGDLGVQRVAESISGRLDDGVERLWVAERNACVHCLGMAGQVSVDGAFDGDITFGDVPLDVWPAPPLLGAPRHPNCRCRTTLWLGSLPGYHGPDLPAVLRREAERSILSGWRTESEREHVRLAAARRVLRRGSTLPKSVRRRAAAAIARGAFDVFPREPGATTP
jgi:hypothetical protein